MDSQPGMLEVASDSGSSDSIINISRSGASSISASSPTSATTTNTTNKEDQFRLEIDKLREEKRNLEGRIRGYRALSDLLVECRRENQELKSEIRTLKANHPASTMSDFDNQSAASSPFSLVSMQAAQNKYNGDLPQADLKKLSLQDPMTASVSRSPVSGPPSSLQETVGPPEDGEETRRVSLPAVNGESDSTGQEEVPKQESLGLLSESQKLASESVSSPASRMVFHGAPRSGSSSPELLQLDSDKYDEATYEKVGLGHAGMTGSMYAASHRSGGRADSRTIDFPSLSSEVGAGLVQPPSHSNQNSIANPPFMAMMHQSQMGQPSSLQASNLASEVENITERLNSEPGDSIPAIAVQMHQIAERISRVEKKERDQKSLVSTLIRENQELKQAMKVAENAHKAEIVALREQNTRLMQQQKSQRRDEETTALQPVATASDWVHVEQPLRQGDASAGSDQSLVDRIRKLELEKAELLRVNGKWKNQWDKMEQDSHSKLNEVRAKLVIGEQEQATIKARLAEQASDFEARMLEMKKRIGEEENLKEEAQHQQHLLERKCSELQDQLTEVKTQLSDTQRDRQVLSAELSVLKSRAAGQVGDAAAASSASKVALEAEIAMLKEQLKVFAEDFEHERGDRNLAQNARDAAKKDAENMARQLHSLSSQVKHLQRQIKDRDDTISITLRQNDTLQRQAADYKKKLAAEWEEKQGLRRMLAQAQQQQQHLRNPYRTEENLPNLYNPAPTYPAAQPQNTGRVAPYSGAQGYPAQPVNRNAMMVVPPEHLPGAWTCSACTYINYPGRTVCETCGMINNPRGHPDNVGYPSHDMYGSEHALLMSRGGDQIHGGNMAQGGDLVVDSSAAQWDSKPY